MVRRGDGVPAYNLAVVVDDAAQGVDQVVRGDDLLSSSPRQAYLARLLGYPEPTYAHVALVLNEDGARLAKRDGAVTLAEIGVQQALAQIAESLGWPASSLDEMLPQFDPATLPRQPWIYRTQPEQNYWVQAFVLLTSAGAPSTKSHPGRAAAGGAAAYGLRVIAMTPRTRSTSSGVLRVGTEGVYSPFSYQDPATGDLTGYDIDVARAVGEKLGKKVEFVETPWDAIFAALEANRFDVVANQVTITPERQAEVRPFEALLGRRRRHRHPGRRRLHQVARRSEGQDDGPDPDQQLGAGCTRCRGQGRSRRGLRPSDHAVEPGPRRRDRQRQHRRLRLSGREERPVGEDRRQRSAKRASRASPPARTADFCPTSIRPSTS